MLARCMLRLLRRTVSLATPLVSAACAGATSGGAYAPPPTPGSLITQETIAASGAKTAWDALKRTRSEEHTSELQSLAYLVCRLLLEKKKNYNTSLNHIPN